MTSWWVRVHIESEQKPTSYFTHPGHVSIVNRFQMFYVKGLTLQSSQAVNNAKRLGWPLKELGGDVYVTQAPGGYPFYLVDKEHPSTGESHGSDTPANIIICQYYARYS